MRGTAVSGVLWGALAVMACGPRGGGTQDAGGGSVYRPESDPLCKDTLARIARFRSTADRDALKSAAALLQREVPHREIPIEQLARWVAHGDPALTPTSADLRARQIELARMMLCDDYTREVFAQHYVMEHPEWRTGGQP